MRQLATARSLVTLTFTMRRFLRDTISLQEARTLVLERMRSRETAFLRMVRDAIFAFPQSPYLQLLKEAGCEFGDVQRMVAQEGIETTLRRLRHSGVYVSYEEFKGRAAAVRGSRTFNFRDTDFDHPLQVPDYQIQSGGTMGLPTRVNVRLEHVAESVPQWVLWFAAHGLLDSPLVFWIPGYFAVSNRHLKAAKFGKRYLKWFTPVDSRDTRTASRQTHALMRWAIGLGQPEFVPLDDAWKVGEYLAGLATQGLRPCINTSPSAAVRICLAMRDRGISLQAVTFLLGGEPLTHARRAVIEAAGARAVPTYGFTEGGGVGSQCPTPSAPDDVHVCLDAFAVTQHDRLLHEETKVGALLFTSLRPSSPKVMLNAEIGDYGILEERRCGCLFDELGYFQHLHTIRSFQKLTGEGVTIIGAEMFPILEDTLPRRYGGTVADYQLVELQDARGLPRYELLVSARVGSVDEGDVVRAFLDALGKIKPAYRKMADLWRRAGLVTVRRQDPIPTSWGKVLPFRTLNAS